MSRPFNAALAFALAGITSTLIAQTPTDPASLEHAQSIGTAIGKPLGILLFGYVVMRLFNCVNPNAWPLFPLFPWPLFPLFPSAVPKGRRAAARQESMFSAPPFGGYTNLVTAVRIAARAVFQSASVDITLKRTGVSRMMHLKIIVVGVFLLALVLPPASSAQSEPLPGKWEKTFTGFGFDEKTKTYLPIVNSKDTECLSEAYFQEKSFHVPYFAAQESERQGRRCVVSNERRVGSTTTWRQVCTDTNGSTEDEQWVISISSDELALEHDTLATKRPASGPGLEARSKQVISLKRIGECDKTVKAQPEANALSQTQNRQSEQEASDRRYEARDEGVVRDTQTGLDWTQSDNGSDINWSEAMRYCTGKGDGWRLGSPDELESLYDASRSTSCGTQACKVSSKFRLTDTWFWSNELKSSSYAWTVYLHFNAPFRSLHHVNPRYYSRAICVRRL